MTTRSGRTFIYPHMNSELGTDFRNLTGMNRYGPIIASARSGWVPRPSIEINRLVESREKTGKARHRWLWVPGPPSFALLASREWSGVAWRLVTSQPVAIHCPLCSVPLPAVSHPSPTRVRTSGCYFFQAENECNWNCNQDLFQKRSRITVSII